MTMPAAGTCRRAGPRRPAATARGTASRDRAGLDALADQELAALALRRHGGFGPAAAHFGEATAKLLGERAMVACVGLEFGGAGNGARAQRVHGGLLAERKSGDNRNHSPEAFSCASRPPRCSSAANRCSSIESEQAFID